MNRAIYAVDIGSTLSGAFAWARVYSNAPNQVSTSHCITHLAKSLRSDLTKGLSVSLGFEAPLFLPVPLHSQDLSRARDNEGNRSWSAPAGLSVATLAIHQISWLFRNLSDLRRDRLLTTHIADWPPEQDQQFFCWEAFVSGPAHADDHMRDAATAATYFLANENNLQGMNAVTANNPLSLFHTAAIWAGWITEVNQLNNQLLVLRPEAPYFGDINDA